MQIGKDRVVNIHYTLKDDQGAVLDSSAGGEPLAYLHGHGNLVPGLEVALEGKQGGDKIEVIVPAEQGYGRRDESLLQRVPKRSLAGGREVKKGMQFQARIGGTMRAFTVTAVIGDMVVMDGNHALADKDLHFAVEVLEVRAPTEEELSHGHVHGVGGHHH